MTFFPTRENCNPDNPEEAFLWMFVALPHVKGGPLMMPVEFYRLVSKRLWELGARPVEEPTLQWVAPMATEYWSLAPCKSASMRCVVLSRAASGMNSGTRLRLTF